MGQEVGMEFILSTARTMRTAPKGHTTMHCAQPVQPDASSSAAVLTQSWGCRLNTCGPQAATQRPQPVQRVGLMVGSALAGIVL